MSWRPSREAIARSGQWWCSSHHGPTGRASSTGPRSCVRPGARDPTVRFLFAGTGAGEAAIRRDLEVGYDERIQVKPTFKANELSGVLAKATVRALPSYIEGFGLGVLETLAAGRPCVAYDVPGPRSLAGAIEPRWLVPVGDAAAFGRRLADVIARERRSRAATPMPASSSPAASAGGTLRRQR